MAFDAVMAGSSKPLRRCGTKYAGESAARVRESAAPGLASVSHQRPDRRLVGVRDALAQRTEQRDRVDVPATTMHQFTAFTF